MTSRGRTRAYGLAGERTIAQKPSYACHWQCVECGYQVSAPAKLHQGGFRRAADDPRRDWRPQTPCPSCGERAWADLSEPAIVETLEAQDEQRQTLFRRKPGVFAAFASVLSWASLATLALAGGDTAGLALLLGLSTTLTLATYIHGAVGEYRLPGLPHAWHHPLPPHGAERSLDAGRLDADAELRAPLSGHSCVAYELGIRHDSNADAPQGSWTLLEQRHAPGLRLDERVLDESVYICFERRVHTEELSPRARMELRKRGLDPERLGYTLFESIAVAGTLAALYSHAQGLLLRAPSFEQQTATPAARARHEHPAEPSWDAGDSLPPTARAA